MANEKQRITLTSADEKLRLAFKNSDGDLSSEWSPASSNATIKAAAEEVYGGTITVTGSRTSSGSTPNRTFSGQANLDFGGSLANEDIPTIQVVQGEQRSVSGTDTVTYNGVDIDPGDAVSDIQTAVRASGVTGDSGVIVNGTSVAGGGMGTNYITAATLTDIQNFGYDHGGPNILNDGLMNSGFVVASAADPSTFTFDLGAVHSIALLRAFAGGGTIVDGGVTATVDLSTTGAFGGEETSVALGLTLNDSWNQAVASTNARYVRCTIPASSNLNLVEFEARGAALGGSLTLRLDYAPGAGNVANPSSSGGTVTTNVQGGSTPSSISVTVLVDGAPLLNTKLNYNYITESGSSSVLDLASVIPDFAGSAVGWTAGIQVADSKDETATLDAVLKHSDTGVFDGEESEVCTFDTVSARGAQHISSDTATDELKQYLRLDYTIAGGTDPGFAIGLAAGPGRAITDE